MNREEFITAARGDARLDLLLKNINLINIFSGEVIHTHLAVHRGIIVGFGAYEAVNEFDLDGLYAAPGFIDGHVHIESSMLSPREFANAIVPQGTTTVIADPHEIVNVMGLEGMRFMLEETASLPLDVFFMLPSCVPATHLETSGATITAQNMGKWIDHPRILGVGEMMNYPDVIHRDPQVLAKLTLAGNKRIDGHAPLLKGKELSAYIIAGITSDHESSELQEAREKLEKGLFVMLREGSAARNLETLLPLVSSLNSRFCGLVTDDRHPDFLMDHGHINSMVETVLDYGIDPIIAFQMAAFNTAEHYGLKDRGALAPGYRADIVLFDNFRDFNIKAVYQRGEKVAENGAMVKREREVKRQYENSVHVKSLRPEELVVQRAGNKIAVIEVIPNQILTHKYIWELGDDKAVGESDPENDILKMVVVERHNASGNLGIGFVKGIGLKHGALASTVAHDSHNIVAVGVRDEDILSAVRELKRMNGGQVVMSGTNVRAALPLPIAGLQSDRPLKEVRKACDALNAQARQLGSVLEDPFMTLSFLSLPVIPELKLTDRGLVDVNAFEIIPLFIED